MWTIIKKMQKGFSLPRSWFLAQYTKCAFGINVRHKFIDPDIQSQPIIEKFENEFPTSVTQTRIVPKSVYKFNNLCIQLWDFSNLEKSFY
jgi:hypothetical protein